MHVYDAYKNYAEEQGITIETPGKFIARVKLLPNVVSRKKRVGGKSERIWRGIGLVGQTEQAEISQKQRRLTPKKESGALGADGAPVIPSPSQNTSLTLPIPPIQDNNSSNPDTINGAPSASSAPLGDKDPPDPEYEIGGTVGTGGTVPINKEATTPEAEIIEDSLSDLDSPGQKMAQYALEYLKQMVGSVNESAFYQAMARGGYHASDVNTVLGMDPRIVFGDGIMSIRKRSEKNETE